MKDLDDLTVAIVGGGIGGLTAALAFARKGCRVCVYEQADALTEVGAGIQVSPNGAAVLEGLGLSDHAAARGRVAEAVIPMAALTGKALARFDLTRGQRPYRFFRRPDLIGMLAEACAEAGVEVELGARIAAADDVGADLVVGADGVKSLVRGDVTGTDRDPMFTGQVAWRAVVPDQGDDPVARIWMAPGKHVVTYPLRDGGLNIVAVQERAEWAAEGWAHADDPGALQAVFSDCSRHLKDILQKIDKVHLWGLFRRPVASRLFRRNVVLVGDAAHPTLPFLAQGANLALEDGYVLAACLEENVDMQRGLAAYQRARHGRVTRAINAANANARNYHLGGMRAAVAHTGLRMMGQVAPSAFLSRLSWLYDHDVTQKNYQLAAV